MDFEIKHISKSEPEQREPRLSFTTDPEKWTKTLSDHAQKGAALGIDCGKMCEDCAFKYNQPHTPEYLESVDNAAKSLLLGGQFHCHASDENGCNIDAGKPCAGYLYTKEYLLTIFDDE